MFKVGDKLTLEIIGKHKGGYVVKRAINGVDVDYDVILDDESLESVFEDCDEDDDYEDYADVIGGLKETISGLLLEISKRFIEEMSDDERLRFFGKKTVDEVLSLDSDFIIEKVNEYTNEAVDKMKQEEGEEDFQVGDEVEVIETGLTFYICRIDGDTLYGISSGISIANGLLNKYKKSEVKKTGEVHSNTDMLQGAYKAANSLFGS